MRNYKKENEWYNKTYQKFYFNARIDNGEAEKLKKAIGDGSFADWVRKHLDEEHSNEKNKNFKKC